MGVPNFEQKVFAVKSNDDSIRSRCTSGGIFLELASKMIVNGGVVYGCAFDDNLKACHIRCASMEDVERCVGSKYSQSDMCSSIPDAITDLKDGMCVLFTGTPCEIAGLIACVPANYRDQLLAVDLVCHGAPSPVLFQQHIGNIERSRKKIVSDYTHRPKNKGWGEYLETVTYSDGTKEQGTRLSGVWKEIFYSETALRPSCYSCPWSIDKRPGDLTIGDYWRIEDSHPEFRDRLGVSLVIANTPAGLSALNEFSLDRIETSADDAILGNPNLVKPTACPSRGSSVWNSFFEKEFLATIREQKFYAPLWKHLYRQTKPLLRKIGVLK